MNIHDPLLTKHFIIAKNDDDYYLYHKHSDYWKISFMDDRYCLVAWNKRYHYKVYFDDVGNLIDFIIK